MMMRMTPFVILKSNGEKFKKKEYWNNSIEGD